MANSLKHRLKRLESWRAEQFDAARAIMVGGRRMPLLQQALMCMEVLHEHTACRDDPEETAAIAADVARLRAHIESGDSDPDLEEECREFLQAMIDDSNEMNADRHRKMALENQQRSLTTP